MVDASYQPGDIEIDILMLTSQNGTLDLSTSFVSADVFESMWTPGIISIISVLDTDDFIGQLQLVGGETVQFQFGAPGGTIVNYQVYLESIVNNTMNSLMK